MQPLTMYEVVAYLPSDWQPWEHVHSTLQMQKSSTSKSLHTHAHTIYLSAANKKTMNEAGSLFTQKVQAR
jgi:hypothetical protein